MHRQLTCSTLFVSFVHRLPGNLVWKWVAGHRSYYQWSCLANDALPPKSWYLRLLQVEWRSLRPYWLIGWWVVSLLRGCRSSFIHTTQKIRGQVSTTHVCLSLLPETLDYSGYFQGISWASDLHVHIPQYLWANKHLCHEENWDNDKRRCFEIFCNKVKSWRRL